MRTCVQSTVPNYTHPPACTAHRRALPATPKPLLDRPDHHRNPRFWSFGAPHCVPDRGEGHLFVLCVYLYTSGWHPHSHMHKWTHCRKSRNSLNVLSVTILASPSLTSPSSLHTCIDITLACTRVLASPSPAHAAGRIAHGLTPVFLHGHLCYVAQLLKKHPGRTIVFTNSIDCVRRLLSILSLLECSPLGLHAQMQQVAHSLILRCSDIRRISRISSISVGIPFPGRFEHDYAGVVMWGCGFLCRACIAFCTCISPRPYFGL